MAKTHLDIIKEFGDLVAKVVKEGLYKLRPFIEQKLLYQTYDNWPSLHMTKCGLPSFYESSFKGPVDYKKAFSRILGEQIIDENSLESLEVLRKFMLSHRYILRRLLHPVIVDDIISGKDKERQEHAFSYLNYYAHDIPKQLIDRYIHLYGSLEFTTKNYNNIFLPIANCIFLKILTIDICVPILFIKFDFDRLEISENISITKMSDKFQLARTPLKKYSTAVHQTVLSSASHALFLENWTFPNENLWTLADYCTDVRIYPLNVINNFLAAFRVVTGVETGYAQLIMNPRGWARNYKADLPPLEGISIRAYPNIFENYYWERDKIPEITKDIALEIGRVFERFNSAEKNKIKIAISRLNQCYLRDDEKDYVIDATIGLEALFSDGSPQEMTHKLAMRIAALATISDTFDRSPYEVFRDIKGIYSYRSAIVHGSEHHDKKRELKLSETVKVPAGLMAIEYLRKCLLLLIKHQEYQDPAIIDEKLLLKSESFS